MHAVTNRGVGSQRGRLAPAAAAVALAIGASCATSPPAEREASRYERLDSELRAADRFRELTLACRAAGGVIYVNRASRQPLSAADLRSARCTSPLRSVH